MSTRMPVVVFDVNETLSDMAPMGRRFTDLGAPEHLARLWFATVVRDGFALTAAGRSSTFAEIARGVLCNLLADADIDRDLEAAVAHVMTGFSELALHPDVPGGVQALADAGHPLITLSNGSAEIAERLLGAAGIRDRFERCLSVDDAGAWKPDRRAYAYAADACGVAMGEMVLVAVHAWDIDGAARAAARTAWINRTGATYPKHFTTPDVVVETLEDLSVRLIDLEMPPG